MKRSAYPFRFTLYITILGFLLNACTSSPSTQQDVTNEASPPSKPNIIYILADDLGYGDLSFTGQTHFETPNIDRLAKEGLFFTQHYSGSTVCAPSRSALMTGLHTGHTPIRGNKEVKPEGQWPIPGNTFTVAKMLQQQGYATGAFGKWGLGAPGSEGVPEKMGFDQFFGYNCQRIAHHYYPYHLWSNDQKVELKENEGTAEGLYAPQLIHNKALGFIEDNQNKPFFLYYPSLIPHAELFAPEEYMEKYRGKFLPEKEYAGTDEGERFRLGPYGTQKEGHAAFAAMVHLLDEQVGEIMKKVEELGIADNTIIFFSSDNGPHLEGGADPDYFNSNGVYKGYKRDLYEGGIRVPFIANWPGKIKAGSRSDHLSAFWDMLPTFAELSGAQFSETVDGISIVPTLLAEGNQKQHTYLYWEFHEKGGRQALRQGDWKLVQYNVNKTPQGELELYNIANDPSEEQNLAAENPEKVKELKKLMNGARTESEVFQFVARK